MYIKTVHVPTTEYFIFIENIYMILQMHTSLCNHSIVWVREFIEYGLTNLDSLGGIVCSLSELSHQMGIDFTQSPQHDTPVFNLC